MAEGVTFAGMKLPIRHIAALVILSLTLVFGYQAYWLLNLYGTQTRLMEVRILEALRASDYNEMMLRVQALKLDSRKRGNVTISAGYSPTQKRNYLQSTSEVTIIGDDSLKQTVKKRLSEGLAPLDTDSSKSGVYVQQSGMATILEQQHNTEQLAVYFQQGLHSGLDMLADVDVQCFDSLLTLRLAELGIDTHHRLCYINRNSTPDSTFTYADTLAVIATPGYVPTGRERTYQHTIDSAIGRHYLLQMEPVSGHVLRQMAGILATSLTILLILGFAFWYLIRTMLRQKSLEEMKSDFTNNITHELKTPIAVAYAANDALLNFDKADDPHLRDKYLRICREQLRVLGGLVEQILSIGMERRKSFRLSKERIALKELLLSLAELHRLKAGKRADITLTVVPEELEIEADRTHFSNIVSNLLDNAVKYSGEEPHITVTAQQSEAAIRLTVSDRGIGITPEQQSRIFDKFYRVPHGNRHDVKGYGLGLYYVKTMVEKHGWQIAVQSEAEKGSTFTITAPPILPRGEELLITK